MFFFKNNHKQLLAKKCFYSESYNKKNNIDLLFNKMILLKSINFLTINNTTNARTKLLLLLFICI